MRWRCQRPRFASILGSVCLVGAFSTVGPGAYGQEITARETAGWHLLRPGESLESIARLYLGADTSGEDIAEGNPRLGELRPGDRIKVELDAGLPNQAAIVSVTGGRIEEQPTPVPWLPGRRFDLLAEGDGLRTFASSSAELWFADTTRLVITEDSLVFLGQGEVRKAHEHPGEIQLIDGQADLKHGIKRRRPVEGVEIVMGPARARPKTNRRGEMETRARRTPQGGAQLMVYRGTSELEAAGRTVQVGEGTGSVVPAGGSPSAPEPLLPAPSPLAPTPGATAARGMVEFRWSPVSGAESYTFELCRDLDCGHLVYRQAALQETGLAVEPPSGGRYFWRVTAASDLRLDGFPSPSVELAVAEEVEIGEAAVEAPKGAIILGSVRSGPGATPLPGVTVRIVGLANEVMSGGDGTFALRGLPTGRYTLEAILEGFLVGRLPDVSVTPDRPAKVVIVSDAALMAREEIVVRPSRVSLLARDPIAPVALSQKDILSLPHLGDDIFRALPMLPGMAANDVTAQFHIRGGRRDEVQILLDGQELYDAFHLKDFDNAQSIVASAALGSVDLTTGGWAAEFGDRMGGVLDMRTQTPPAGRRSRLGISLLNLQAGTSGTFQDERGTWLLMARRGSIDLAGKILGQEDPSYWDALSKARYTLGTRQSLSAHVLLANDRLRFEEVDGAGFKRLGTTRDSGYAWLTHQALLSTKIFTDSFASWSQIDSFRQARDIDEDQRFEVDDRRTFDVAELRQEWNLEATPRHLLAWGFGARRFDPTYGYRSVKEYDTPLALIRAEPEGEFGFQGGQTGEHSTGYLTDRVRLTEPLVVELGMRYDHYSWLGEDHLSPRLNLAYSLGEASVVRAAWGFFYQSQRPYELQVEDSETQFFPAERSEQALLGFEHVFDSAGKAPGWLSGLALRVEAYRREIRDPRPRYENLYEPFNEYPELEPDRVLLVPDRSVSQGIELFLRSSEERKVAWWMNYSLASSDDHIDGRRVRRLIDQTHTLNLSLSLPLTQRWVLNLAWRYHTGWPTTPLTLTRATSDLPEGLDEEPEIIPVLGPVNSQRLGVYHRLDLRASRELPVRRGRMTFFVDVQNVYNRTNHSGFDFSIDEEQGLLLADQEKWPGFFPSVGISWEF